MVVQSHQDQNEQGHEVSGLLNSSSASQTLQDLGALNSLIAHGLLNPVEFYTSIGPTLNELTMGLLGPSFKPERDIADLTGKVVFVTGGMLDRRLFFGGCYCTYADYVAVKQETQV